MVGVVRDLEKRSGEDLATDCEERYMQTLGQAPDPREVTSWQNSWPPLLTSLMQAGKGDLNIALEYQIARGYRVDAVVLGISDASPGLKAIFVELKQWKRTSPFDYDITSELVTYRRGDPRLHPVAQLSRYLGSFAGTTRKVWDELRGLVLLHNADEPFLHDLATARQEPGVELVGAAWVQDPLRRAPKAVRDLRPASARQVSAFLDAVWEPPAAIYQSLADALTPGPTQVPALAVGEQHQAIIQVVTSIEAGRQSGVGRLHLVTGSAGTGKTVLGLHLLATLRALSPVLQIKNSSVRLYLERFLTEEQRSLLTAPNFGRGLPGVVIIDEAHRVPKLLTELDRLYRNNPGTDVVLLLDEQQRISPQEGATTTELRARFGHRLAGFHTLTRQFRNNGSAAYERLLSNLLNGILTETTAPPDYDFAVAPTIEALSDWAGQYGSAGRLAAGYCWPWPRDDTGCVTVGAWSRPWNFHSRRTDADRTGPASPAWAWGEAGEGQVGCIYTSQGLEVDYIGVVIGPDLLLRKAGDGRLVWTSNLRALADGALLGAFRAAPSEDPLPYLINLYRILMTRGTRGARVFAVDPETQARLLAWWADTSGRTPTTP